jgi:8-oxo-dGTP pyrophosphatase MutT (NUDIX family)
MNYKKVEDEPDCAGFVVLAQDHVLLVSTHNGNWGFPKGKKKKKESLIECAHRELYEETGLDGHDIMSIDTENLFFNEISKKGRITVRLYLAALNTDHLIQPVINDQEELEKAEWVEIHQAEKILTVKNRSQVLRDAVKTLNELMDSKNVRNDKIIIGTDHSE